MTPQEIFEHKQRWMSSGDNNPVRIHSDMRHNAKDFCKKSVSSSGWVHRQYTNVYEDTFFFEQEEDAASFRKYFEKWVDTSSESV